MHLWTIENWVKIYEGQKIRSGLRVRHDPGVHPEMRGAIMRFVAWLRTEYYFPMRVTVYVKASEYVRASDGEEVNGVFFGPYDPLLEPRIRVGSRDYPKNSIKRGRDNALAAVLYTLAHELTHYFQWVNQIKLTERGEEWQATFYSNIIVQEYAEIVKHP